MKRIVAGKWIVLVIAVLAFGVGLALFRYLKRESVEPIRVEGR